MSLLIYQFILLLVTFGKCLHKFVTVKVALRLLYKITVILARITLGLVGSLEFFF